MRLLWRLRSLICCSSQKPISRRRWETSGEAESCLMRTAVPAMTRLNGQRNGSFGQPFSPKQLDIKPFTVSLTLWLLRLSCKKDYSSEEGGGAASRCPWAPPLPAPLLPLREEREETWVQCTLRGPVLPLH